jgi:hypothetical protein
VKKTVKSLKSGKPLRAVDKLLATVVAV